MIQKIGRQSIVDEIRGLSLLGILLSNLLIFQYGMWGKDEIDLFGLTGADSVAHTLVKIVIEGSFMPIFAFLFGFGMLKLMEGLEAKGAGFRMVIVRRSIMLIGLGMLHSYFLWEGDILLLYGGMSLFLLLFLRRKAKTVLIWGIALLPVIGLAGMDSTGPLIEETKIIQEKTEAYVMKSIDVYQNGSYSEIFAFRHDEPKPLEADGLILVAAYLLVPFMTAPMFLFGMYAARKDWFYQPETKRAFYFKWASVFLISGLIMKSIKQIWPDTIFGGVSGALGMLILSLGYIMGFALLLSLGKATALRNGFKSVGKLSLTNYLLQTVICTTLFYGYGFGWYGKLGIIAGVGIGIAIYTLQLLGSALYLKRFRIGPVEWLLRIWTYWSWNGKPKQRIADSVDVKA
ncbi:DUF418 domain-containing protein [Paenibacillus sp. NPDC057967]|uniref:DUF418 domain-containing protein n=1 Tax=Paenibacillus sp. NPDC057967 TaxID=3346293 RepID=UPI0036D9BD33